VKSGVRWALAAWTIVCVVLWVLFKGAEGGETGLMGFLAVLTWFVGVILGAAVLVPIVLIREARRGPPTGLQLVCTNCGAPLYSQWRTGSDNRYACRACGQTTAGRISDVPPP